MCSIVYAYTHVTILDIFIIVLLVPRMYIIVHIQHVRFLYDQIFDTFVEPKIWDLISIVTPKVKASWGSLAYSMGYDIEDVKGWEADSKESHERCRRLFERWLSGGDGCTPKTWRKLLERIKAVNELSSAADNIKEELLSRQKEQ